MSSDATIHVKNYLFIHPDSKNERHAETRIIAALASLGPCRDDGKYHLELPEKLKAKQARFDNFIKDQYSKLNPKMCCLPTFIFNARMIIEYLRELKIAHNATAINALCDLLVIRQVEAGHWIVDGTNIRCANPFYLFAWLLDDAAECGDQFRARVEGANDFSFFNGCVMFWSTFFINCHQMKISKFIFEVPMDENPCTLTLFRLGYMYSPGNSTRASKWWSMITQNAAKKNQIFTLQNLSQKEYPNCADCKTTIIKDGEKFLISSQLYGQCALPMPPPAAAAPPIKQENAITTAAALLKLEKPVVTAPAPAPVKLEKPAPPAPLPAPAKVEKPVTPVPAETRDKRERAPEAEKPEQPKRARAQPAAVSNHEPTSPSTQFTEEDRRMLQKVYTTVTKDVTEFDMLTTKITNLLQETTRLLAELKQQQQSQIATPVNRLTISHDQIAKDLKDTMATIKRLDETSQAAQSDRHKLHEILASEIKKPRSKTISLSEEDDEDEADAHEFYDESEEEAEEASEEEGELSDEEVEEDEDSEIEGSEIDLAESSSSSSSDSEEEQPPIQLETCFGISRKIHDRPAIITSTGLYMANDLYLNVPKALSKLVNKCMMGKDCVSKDKNRGSVPIYHPQVSAFRKIFTTKYTEKQSKLMEIICHKALELQDDASAFVAFMPKFYSQHAETLNIDWFRQMMHSPATLPKSFWGVCHACRKPDAFPDRAKAVRRDELLEIYTPDCDMHAMAFAAKLPGCWSCGCYFTTPARNSLKCNALMVVPPASTFIDSTLQSTWSKLGEHLIAVRINHRTVVNSLFCSAECHRYFKHQIEEKF